MSVDDPDLTFLKNRGVGNMTAAQLMEGVEGLKSISEEEKESSETSPSVSHDKGRNHVVTNGTVAHLDADEFAPEDGTLDGLKDSKIDQISSQYPSGKSRNGLSAIWKIFMVCFICVLLSLFFVAIIVIELDMDMTKRMRQIPEVVYFQFEIYEPFKSYMRAKLHSIEQFH